MGVQVAFNYNLWVLRFPEFSSVPADLAQAYFDEATLYHRNDGGGPVTTTSVQAVLLNVLTAHIAQLYKIKDGQPQSELVGRISSANEGSVSVQADMDVPPGTPQWYAQTKYGSSYWAATSVYRTMRYKPGPR